MAEDKAEELSIAKDKRGRVIKEGASSLLHFRVTKIDNKRPRGAKPIVHLQSVDEHGPSKTKTGIWAHDDEIELIAE